MKSSRFVRSCIFTDLILLCFCFIDAVFGQIEWRKYDAKFLKTETHDFYRYSWDAHIPVPQVHPSSGDSDSVGDKVFQIYVRKFSRQKKPKKHLWLISGGPGSSTSGIERALSAQLPDTAIYIMDPRGLGHSHSLCHHSESQMCIKKPAKCYKRLDYDPKNISVHETAKDYNMISRMILEAESGGGSVYMYGSSYGSVLAYTCFRFDPKLYAGLLLEAFVPEFRLNEDADVRRHVINSCFASETCYASIGGKLTKEEAMELVGTLTKEETQNPCKAGLEFLAQNSLGKNLNVMLNSYIRVAFYKKTGLRSSILPILYGAAYCPDLEVFNGLLREFHETYVKISEDSKSELSQLVLPPTNEMHCSNTPNTNSFFGNHIRYSEYAFESGEKFKKCRDVGYLISSNWADVCGMVSDFKDDYEPYMYEPVVANPTFGELANSLTRIVIATGKLDTQTPHDLAEKEFDMLPIRHKHLFSADHGGHGIIDSWEVPGLRLDLMLDFMMTGSVHTEASLRDALRRHNEDAERIWKHHDKKVFGEREIWNLEESEREYNANLFFLVSSCCLLPIFATFMVKRRQLNIKVTL